MWKIRTSYFTLIKVTKSSIQNCSEFTVIGSSIKTKSISAHSCGEGAKPTASSHTSVNSRV